MTHAALRDSLPEHAILTAGSPASVWPTLLVVDNDREMLRTLVCYFEKRGFHVAAGTSIAEAKQFYDRRKTWTLVIADYHLPDGTGWELCCWIRDQVRPPPVLLMSGSTNCAALCGGMDYLPKPFRLEDLEARVRTLLNSGR
jgi:DNA-binding response OmpR family regulator